MPTARYDLVADSYGVGFDASTVSATRKLMELVGSVEGMRVLDVACGHGLITREIARRGAGRVLGIDLSAGLLRRAAEEEQADPLGVEYVEADASSRESLVDEEFDIVVSNFGLSDIDDLDGLCAVVARVLTRGGTFVFSILHPCFPGCPDVSGAWPAEGSYYDENWWAATGQKSTLRQVVGSNHRMVSTYLNALHRHGLTLEGLHEPEPDAFLIERSPEMAQYPVYLVAEFSADGVG